MKKRLLVFDWDGTLIDSIGTIIDCTLASFRELGLPEPTREKVRSAIGLGLRESVEYFYPGTDDELFGKVLETYRDLWVADYTSRSELFEGVPDVLTEFREDGYQLAIATAKSRPGLERELERTGIGGLFAATRTVDECPPKPDPGMLETLAEELGVEAREMTMVGDTTWDLDMARNAGVDAVAVKTGAHGMERLLGSEPKACLDSVLALPAWLRNGGAS